MNTAAPAEKAGPSLGLSIAVLLVGLALGAGCLTALVVQAVPSVASALTSRTYATPADFNEHLSGGHYVLFEQTGQTAGAGSTDVSQPGVSTIGPADVTVTASDGSVVAVRAPSGSQTITRGTDAYTAAVSFATPTTDDYQIHVNGNGDRVFVARSLGDTVKNVAAWGVGIGFGGLVFLLGLLLLVVGLVRRHGQGAAAAPPHYGAAAPPTAAPPPGWYPDPAGSGAQRYWDGTAWSSSTSGS